MRPRSDVDVLVVAQRRTTADERRTLVEGLMELSGGGLAWGKPRPIELTVVVQADIRPWRYPPRVEFQYGEWLRGDYERGLVPAPSDASPDLAPIITMVLRGNRPVFGPPPADLLDPIPEDDLVRAITAGIPDLLADLDSDTANVVLTFVRIWATVATGTIWSKDGAANWALARLPEEHRAVLVRARGIYTGEEDPNEQWDDLRADIRPHVDAVLAEIEQAAVLPHG